MKIIMLALCAILFTCTVQALMPKAATNEDGTLAVIVFTNNPTVAANLQGRPSAKLIWAWSQVKLEARDYVNAIPCFLTECWPSLVIFGGATILLIISRLAFVRSKCRPNH